MSDPNEAPEKGKQSVTQLGGRVVPYIMSKLSDSQPKAPVVILHKSGVETCFAYC